MNIVDIINTFAINHQWVFVVIGVLWGVDQILKVIAPLTKTKLDDNLADYLGNFLASVTGKKQP